MTLDPLSDIEFWSRQLSEHALFLQLGLEVEPFKSQAAKLHRIWEHARAVLPGKSLEEAKQIVWKPTQELANFKHAVLNEQHSGKWVGWLFPLFVDHTLRELSYFVERVWGKGLSPEQTYCSNVTFMQEHAEFAAHLLDPTAIELIEPARAVAGEFKGLRESGCRALTPALVELGRKAGDKLDQYLRTQPISPKNSVIHPVLTDHVIREGQRFLETMGALGHQVGTPKGPLPSV